MFCLSLESVAAFGTAQVLKASSKDHDPQGAAASCFWSISWTCTCPAASACQAALAAQSLAEGKVCVLNNAAALLLGIRMPQSCILSHRGTRISPSDAEEGLASPCWRSIAPQSLCSPITPLMGRNPFLFFHMQTPPTVLVELAGAKGYKIHLFSKKAT